MGRSGPRAACRWGHSGEGPGRRRWRRAVSHGAARSGPDYTGRGGVTVIVGVPKEIKTAEQRIALTPAGARALSEREHRVLVEVGAGVGSGIRDEEFARNGAALVTADE